MIQGRRGSDYTLAIKTENIRNAEIVKENRLKMRDTLSINEIRCMFQVSKEQAERLYAARIAD